MDITNILGYTFIGVLLAGLLLFPGAALRNHVKSESPDVFKGIFIVVAFVFTALGLFSLYKIIAAPNDLGGAASIFFFHPLLLISFLMSIVMSLRSISTKNKSQS